MKKSHIIILVIALLGGGAYAALEYWDVIAPMIGLAPEAPAVPVRAARTDTAPAEPAEPTVEEYQGKIGEILTIILDNEGKFLYGSAIWGYSANIEQYKVSYPQGQNRKNINLTGKLQWLQLDDWSACPWRLELQGEPVGNVIVANVGNGQIQDVAAGRSYEGTNVANRLWYELTNPLYLLPMLPPGFKLTQAERGEEEGVVKLTLEPEQNPDNGFCTVRAMTLEVKTDGYALVRYTLKMYVDGKVVTHSTNWEKDGDNYRIGIDNGVLVVQGERTAEQMVLACAGDNPATYTFTYGDSVVTGIAVEMKRDGVEYAIALTELEPITGGLTEESVAVGAAFKNPGAAGEWGKAKMGWGLPADFPAPADEEGEAGAEGDTSVQASAEEGDAAAAGDEAKPAAGEEEENAEPAGEERQTASAARPAATPRQQPRVEPAEEPEEAEEPAPAPARPSARPRETARPAATTTTTASRPAASGSTATVARPVSRPAVSAYTLGVKAYREGRHGEAERQLLTAVRQQPGNASAQLMLGEIYYGRGDYARAQACLSRAAQLSSQSWIGTRARQLLQRMGYPY